jgi:hypothetical protein
VLYCEDSGLSLLAKICHEHEEAPEEYLTSPNIAYAGRRLLMQTAITSPVDPNGSVSTSPR